ncbi:hypothetical protein N7535_002496 [Penicillium sp. DV-2018c]|nr:hypothetical protein N7461_001820 [Penicillium sp. DV-2018c]KAJ5575570.1 hypothetical protein N7535_002496 [Penicillium sp. DV-2018c]
MDPKPYIKFKLNGVSKSGADVDGFELQAYSRALNNLRSLLFQQPMLDLLQNQIEEGDRYFESLIEASGGLYRECRIFMKVSGITATDFKAICSRWHASQPLDDMARRYVFPTHPEHYVAMQSPDAPEGGGPDCGVELIGEHMARIRYVDLTQTPVDVPTRLWHARSKTYDMMEVMVAKLDSGSKFFYLMNEFVDTGGGCKIRLRVFFPSAAPWSLINQHAEHLAVEFRNLLKMVHAAVKTLEDSY